MNRSNNLRASYVNSDNFFGFNDPSSSLSKKEPQTAQYSQHFTR